MPGERLNPSLSRNLSSPDVRAGEQPLGDIASGPISSDATDTIPEREYASILADVQDVPEKRIGGYVLTSPASNPNRRGSIVEFTMEADPDLLDPTDRRNYTVILADTLAQKVRRWNLEPTQRIEVTGRAQTIEVELGSGRRETVYTLHATQVVKKAARKQQDTLF